MKMKIIRPLIYLVSILAGVFLLFLLYATIDDYRPDELTVQPTECEQDILSDSLDLEHRICRS